MKALFFFTLLFLLFAHHLKSQQFDCATENFDFENGAVGWNLTGRTSIVNGGVDPYGGFPWVYPGGGTRSLRISSDDNLPTAKWGQASKTINVPANGTTLFTFHFAMAIFNFPHPATAAAKFRVIFRDGLNNIIPCPNYECYFSTDNGTRPNDGSVAFVATPNSAQFYKNPVAGDGPNNRGVTYSNWNDVTLDLSVYAGQTITANFRVDWCFPVPDISGPDWAYALIDAECPVNNFQPIAVCGGAGQPISGPPSMATYSWTTPSGETVFTKTITATTAGSYTLKCTPQNIACTAAPALTYTYDVQAFPIADFNDLSTPCQTNLTVPFTDNTNLNGGPALVSYDWEWGDGTANGSANTENHIFDSPGMKTVTLTVSNGNCTSKKVKNINLTLKPTVNFIANNVCQGVGTVFQDQSSTTLPDVISGWEWDYNSDGIVDDAITQSPTYTYASSGTFNSILKVTSSGGCQSTMTLPVEVWGRSLPDFTPDKVCYGTNTTFNNLTNTTFNPNVGSITAYSWDFADGTPASSFVNPLHTYADGNVNAVYNVSLTAITNHNCIDQVVKQVNVYALPTASFTSNEVCFGTPSQLTDASNGEGNTITDYSWDYLSNNTIDVSGMKNPSYIFPAFGNNSVSYSVTTSPTVGLTCTSYTTQNVWVNPNPVANFIFFNACVNAQPNAFDASASNIAIGTNTNYAWTYGDGATLTTSSIAITSHTYLNAGNYNVGLTVTSDRGCVNSITKITEVYKKPIMEILNSDACDTKVMTFTATTQPNSGIVTNWFWDFNNNQTTFEASGRTSGYVFPAPDNQTVTLITETDNGCRDTISKVVYVDYVPKPLFSVNDPDGCPLPHCVVFTDNTLPIVGPATNTTWKWVFGDGTVLSSTTNTTQAHCYTNTSSSQNALYDVKLVVTSSKGCTDSLEKKSFITVYPKPVAQYNINPNPGNVVTPLIYFNNESQDFTKLWWHFGDNSAVDSVNINPTHYYESETADTYNSVLMVSNAYGCRDTAYVNIEIGPEFIFYIPNAFTPGDEDAINQVFVGKGIGIANYEMWIYDRWGDNIYYTDDITKGWNGKVLGKEKECPQDVYVWKVKIKDVLNKRHEYVGHVTLLR